MLCHKQRYKHYVAYRQSGWLYVEYVVTLLLITVISTFTMGNYSDEVKRDSITQYETALVNLITMAQNRAVTTNSVIEVCGAQSESALGCEHARKEYWGEHWLSVDQERDASSSSVFFQPSQKNQIQLYNHTLSKLEFSPEGTILNLQEDEPTVFVICAIRVNHLGRMVYISASGEVFATESTSCP